MKRLNTIALVVLITLICLIAFKSCSHRPAAVYVRSVEPTPVPEPWCFPAAGCGVLLVAVIYRKMK